MSEPGIIKKFTRNILPYVKQKKLELNGTELPAPEEWFICLLQNCTEKNPFDRLMNADEIKTHLKDNHDVSYESKVFTPNQSLFEFLILHKVTEASPASLDISSLLKLISEWNTKEKNARTISLFVCLLRDCQNAEKPPYDLEDEMKAHLVSRHENIKTKELDPHESLKINIIYKKKILDTQIAAIKEAEKKKSLVNQAAQQEKEPEEKRKKMTPLTPSIILKCKSCSCEFRILPDPKNPSHEYKENDDFLCGFCDVAIETPEGGTQAQAQSYENKGKCHFCSQTFDLDDHLKTEYGAKLGQCYECTVCGEKLYNLDQANGHMKTHEPATETRCSQQ